MSIVPEHLKDSVEYLSVDDLIPYVGNARTHSTEQVTQIVASIREFGWTNPVLIDEGGEIIAGHGRILAARELGVDDVPCLRLRGLNDRQKRAYRIADNKIALNAGWDDALLKSEFDALSGEFDLELTGFSETEIDNIIEGHPISGNEINDDLSYRPTFEVVVKCADEVEQELVYKLLTEKGYQCRVLSA